jgi:uncharacterized protein (UPF0332 family)
MAFEWVRYLNLARELAKRTDEESLRSSISRAYYAAFNTAADHLRSEGIVVPKADAHTFVWNTFRSSTDMERGMIGENGDRLRIWRNYADYSGVFPNLDRYVKTALPLAEKILRNLADLSTPDSPG